MTTTTLDHTKGSANTFLCHGQDEAQKVQYVGEMSWEVSFMITTGSPHFWFLASDEIFRYCWRIM
jgi:hypothetical protein